MRQEVDRMKKELEGIRKSSSGIETKTSTKLREYRDAYEDSERKRGYRDSYFRGSYYPDPNRDNKYFRSGYENELKTQNRNYVQSRASYQSINPVTSQGNLNLIFECLTTKKCFVLATH